MNNLGQDIEFSFSQKEIKNINLLLHLLKLRLGSSSKIKDMHENILITDIFPINKLVGFLILSLSEFNQTYPFTNFSFKDTAFTEFFSDALITGATIHALSSQALIEKGREYSLGNDSLTVDMPNVSDMLNDQFLALLKVHHEKISLIKNNIAYWDIKSEI